MRNYLGIDVSKDALAVAISAPNGKYAQLVFDNSEEGIKQLMAKLPEDCHCTVEATGVYSRLVAYMLHDAGVRVSVINPKQYVYFAKMILSTVKTDAIDAAILAMYGERMSPPAFAPTPHKVLEIKQKFSLLNQFRKQRQSLRNLAHAMSVDVVHDASSKERLDAMMEILGAQIKEIEAEVCKCTEQEFKDMLALASSVKGIGKKTASLLINATNGFASFTSAKQVSKFLGLSPSHRQSGTSFNYSPGICRSGDPYIRSVLFLCSWTAIKHNLDCKNMYERLKKKGKPSMVALIAVANKLVRQVFAVVKSGIPFDNNYCERCQQIVH